MQKYGVNELRRMFLEFFESKDHLAMKSFSLVPHNDNSLLLINAGMAPLKPYFTGQEIPPRRRVCTLSLIHILPPSKYGWRKRGWRRRSCSPATSETRISR